MSADSGASDTEKSGKIKAASVENVEEEEKKAQTNPEEETKEYRSPSMTDCIPGAQAESQAARELEPIPFALAGQGL